MVDRDSVLLLLVVTTVTLFERLQPNVPGVISCAGASVPALYPNNLDSSFRWNRQN